MIFRAILVYYQLLALIYHFVLWSHRLKVACRLWDVTFIVIYSYVQLLLLTI